MKGMTPEAMAKACDGKLLNCEKILGQEVTAVITDSRKTTSGAAFVAIKGERADGHSFVKNVIEAGAMLAIVEEAPSKEVPCILVESTLLAIQRIAELYRVGLGIPVVGVTGSVGKTSTKEAIAAVLGTKFRVLKTAGNFNNNLGLPLTIFRLTEEDEIAVLEMGISHFGEMEDLARTARPDVMVITNIGTCHLEFLGDRDGIFRAKTACLPYVRNGGEVILNYEDDKLSQVTPEKLRKLQMQSVTFGDGANMSESGNRLENNSEVVSAASKTNQTDRPASEETKTAASQTDAAGQQASAEMKTAASLTDVTGQQASAETKTAVSLTDATGQQASAETKTAAPLTDATGQQASAETKTAASLTDATGQQALVETKTAAFQADATCEPASEDAQSGLSGVSGPTFYGFSAEAAVCAKEVATHGLAGSSFTICMDGREIPVRLALPGRHMILNALAAAAVGRHFGLSDAEIAEGIASQKPLGGRVNILETASGTVIDDCYNASPASVKAALDLLASVSGSKTAILGDMGELGANERALHREVGVHAGKLPIDTILLAGHLTEETAEGIRSVRPDAKILHFPDTEALIEALPESLKPGGSILVKASHFMGFDRVVKEMEKN